MTVELTGAGGEPLVPTDLAEQIRSYAQKLVAGGPASIDNPIADPLAGRAKEDQ